MTTWTIGRLSHLWDPVQATSDTAASQGIAPWPTVRLGDLVTLIPPTSLAYTTEWVWPRNVSDATGIAVVAIRRRPSASGYRVGVNIESGDVLLPRHSLGPCVLVQPDQPAVSFTDDFIALHPKERGAGLLLWGVLSSSGGLRYRQSIATGIGDKSIALSRLADLLVPMPTVDRAEAIRACLPAVGIDRRARDARETKWSFEDARTANWGMPFETLGLGYVPVRSLRGSAEVYAGSVTARDRVLLPLPGCLPVALPENVRSKRWVPAAWAWPDLTGALGTGPKRGSGKASPRRSLGEDVTDVGRPWRPPRGGVHRVTAGREILVPAVYRFLPAIAPPGWLVGRDVFAITPMDLQESSLLLGWLESEHGQAVLKRLVSRPFIPRLTLSALRDLPLPPDLDQVSESTKPGLNLAVRLQEALR